MSSIMKTSSQFKDETISIVRTMPLKSILFIPDSYVDIYIDRWLKVDEKTGMSKAHEDYKRYYQYLTSLPDDLKVMDVNLYMFKVARSIIDDLLVDILQDGYYNSVFYQSNMSKKDVEYFVTLTRSIIDRLQDHITQESKELLYKNIDNIPDMVNKE